jgi:DNA-binding beta-propeller fold protein YncE
MMGKWRWIIGLALADLLLLLLLLGRHGGGGEPAPVSEGHGGKASADTAARPAPTPAPASEPSPPQGLELLATHVLQTGRGVKSVLFDPAGQYCYAMNLESGNVQAFDRASRKEAGKWVFAQTPAKGYDYDKRAWVGGSFAEKPVEGCFSHGGSYLWVSWHNGGGVAALRADASEPAQAGHRAASYQHNGQAKKVAVHFFPTGNTPKVMVLSPDGTRLWVANWHDHTITALDISGDDPAGWKDAGSVKIGGTPRGLCFAPDGRLLVGKMATGEIASVDPAKMEAGPRWRVLNTPRHLLSMGNRVWVSHSSPERIGLYDLSGGGLKPVREAVTQDDPRTIALSPDGRVLLAVCYASNSLQVFRAADLKLLGTFPCPGAPVGVAVWQEGDVLEAWAANYKYATLRVFRFRIR